MTRRARLFLVPAALALLLAACSTATEEAPPAPSPTVERTVEPTATSSPTPLPTATPEPEPTATPEPDSEGATLPVDFVVADIGSLNLSLGRPITWLHEEDPELGLVVESHPGVMADPDNLDGAALLLLPRDELAVEDTLEALRQSVFLLGPPPQTLFIEYPIVTTVGDHEFATAAYNDSASGQIGFYAFVKNGGRGIFILAMANGTSKDADNQVLETIINSVRLVSAADS